MTTTMNTTMYNAVEDIEYIIQDAPVNVHIDDDDNISLTGSRDYLSLMHTVSETIRKRYNLVVEINNHS